MELRALKARAEAEASDRTTASPHIHRLTARLGTAICDAICARYEQGETADALATEHGVSRNAILNLLRARAVRVRHGAPTSDQIATAISEYEAGSTIALIAQGLGLSYGAIRRALKLAGVKMRPRGFQPKE